MRWVANRQNAGSGEQHARGPLGTPELGVNVGPLVLADKGEREHSARLGWHVASRAPVPLHANLAAHSPPERAILRAKSSLRRTHLLSRRPLNRKWQPPSRIVWRTCLLTAQ